MSQEVEKLGLGTAYEKIVLRQILEKLAKKYNWQFVLEFPANNYLGNNEDVWRGLAMDYFPEKKPGQKFDVVWNFCAFEQTAHPPKFFQELTGIKAKYFLIICQNNRNLGIWLHRLSHWLQGKYWDHGQIKLMSAKIIKRLARKNGLKLIKRNAFDLPWFILDIHEDGRWLKKIVPKKIANPEKIKTGWLEKLPYFIKKNLAHHHYLLFKL